MRRHGTGLCRWLPVRRTVLWANDIDGLACDTYAANLGDDHPHRGSIIDVLDTLPDTADVVIGGFPCQDVSINGQRRVATGERTILYQDMVDVIQRTSPTVFVAENVKGLLMSHGKPFFDQMLADFAMPGIHGHAQALSRRGPRHTADARAHLHRWRQVQRAVRPSGTAGRTQDGAGSLGGPGKRRISLRKAARLQSFPDDFDFVCAMRATERQIGNAVPAVLAWHIAKAVRKHFDCGRV